MPFRPPDRELRTLRAVTSRLPPFPKTVGLVRNTATRLYNRVDRGLVVADVLGTPFQLDPAELVDGMLLFTPQLFDRRERRWIEAQLHSGDVFLDLGAHVGFYSAVAARLGARVLAVEPHPITVQRLRYNLASFPNALVVEIAVGDTAANGSLGDSDVGNRGSASLLRGTTGFSVGVKPVLALLAAVGVAHVDAVKLDIEGGEYRALKPWLGSLVFSERPRWLVFEHHPGLISAAGGDTVALLRRFGYRISPLSGLNFLATRS